MRTTLDLDDRLLAAAKRRAAEAGTTLTAFVESALASALAARPKQQRYHLDWKTTCGRSPPRVDVADRDALFDAMERGT